MQKPRRLARLALAASLLYPSGAAPIGNGAAREVSAVPIHQIMEKVTVDGFALQENQNPQQSPEETGRKPIVLEVGIDSAVSVPLEISYDSMGLAGKMDVSTHTLTDVPTKVVESAEVNKAVVVLAKVRRGIDGKIIMTDMSPTGMDEKAKKLLQQTLVPTVPVLDAAFDIGGMFEMTIGSQQSPGSTFRNHSQSEPRTKGVFVDINIDQGFVDPVDVQATVWHEVAHTIFAKRAISHSIKEFMPGTDSVDKFSTACKAVRDVAGDELETNSSVFVQKLEQVSEKIPKIRPAVDQLIEAVREKTLNGLFPQQGASGEGYAGINTCNFIGGSGILGDISKTLGVNFDFRQEPEGAATQEEKDILREVDMFMKQFVHKDSIYRIITDATYVMDPMAGHPYDNLDEAAASMFMITNQAPDEFVRLLFSVPQEKREVMIRFYETVMGEFTLANPKLVQILQPNIDKIKKAYYSIV